MAGVHLGPRFSAHVDVLGGGRVVLRVVDHVGAGENGRTCHWVKLFTIQISWK